MHDAFDVAVIGGGPVGAALALELAAADCRVALVERRATGSSVADRRPLALSYGSRLILERLGIWPGLAPATPIDRIHVSQRGAFGRAVLTSAEAGLRALGFVVDYAAVVAAFDTAIDAAPVSVYRGARVSEIDETAHSVRVGYAADGRAGELAASFVVVADGGALPAGAVRVRDYGQTAITARVKTSQPHRGTAYERFTVEGPIALLPYGDDYALVWTVRQDDGVHLLGASDTDFLARLQERFGERAGRFAAVSGRAAYDLALRVSEQSIRERTILIGNAAQALHPVAGQGFNLGLRDAWELAEEFRRRGPADATLPAAYRARRRIDRAGGIAFTDSLVSIFSSDSWPLTIARGAGLALIDSVPPLKNFIVRRMVFGARA